MFNETYKIVNRC